METPEERHRACWYSRRTSDIPPDIGFHTIEDGQLLFCEHMMWFPVVGYQFDVRNCASCDYFKPTRASLQARSWSAQSFATAASPSVANCCNQFRPLRNPPPATNPKSATYSASPSIQVGTDFDMAGV